MKSLMGLLLLLLIFLGYRVLRLESEVSQLQKNVAIAVLSAEAAHKKIGAFAPYFQEDKEAFANAWLDDFNMPAAVFPEDTLIPIKNELAKRRSDLTSQKLKSDILNGTN
jgi:hypothetical protein